LTIAVPAATDISQLETLRPPSAMPGIDSIILITLKGEERRDFSYLLASFSMRGIEIPALVYKDI
jgi:hypothetical protein